MKRKRAIIILSFLAVIAVLAWWLLRSPKPAPVATSRPPSSSASPLPAAGSPPPATPAAERRKAVVEKIMGVLATSITFYGKVIDQNGDPVPDAAVGYSALDKFMEPGTGYTGTSDGNGQFSISGIRGARLSVNVRKEGYYFIDGKSNAAFAYGMGPDGYFREPPTKENPTIFVLQKMGKTEPLIYVGSRYYKLNKTGDPIEADLKTGKQVPAGQGDIRFERWASDQAKNERGRFDWRFRITVPEGGIVEREGQFSFDAPQEGYQNVAEINMPASLGDKWQYTVDKSYFVKLPEDRYARVNVTIEAGHDNPAFKLDSYLNPKPGSRNLEFDPAKVIKSQ